MLDLIEFGINLFTEPLLALLTILILGAVFVGFSLYGGYRDRRMPLDQAPQVVLQHILKFDDDDLKENRQGWLSPKQRRRLLREMIFLLLFIGVLYSVIIGLFIWAELGTLFVGGAIVFLLLLTASITWIFYIRELWRGEVVTILTKLHMEQKMGEYLLMKFPTNVTEIVVNHPNLKQPLRVTLGHTPPQTQAKLASLQGIMHVLYVSPNTNKLYAMELA